MSDIADDADCLIERERIAGHARIRESMTQPGAIHCEWCGLEIPEARRAAVPFAIRCFDCQTIFERGA